MSDKKKYNNGRKDFLRYFAGKMRGEERNAFERKLQRDEFEAEAAEGYEKVSPADAGRDLNELDDRLLGKTSSGKGFLYFRIAAAVAFLLMVSGLFYYYSDRQISESRSQMARTEDLQEKEPAEETGIISDSAEGKVEKEPGPEPEMFIKPEESLTESTDIVSQRDGTKARKDLTETITVVNDQEVVAEEAATDEEQDKAMIKRITEEEEWEAIAASEHEEEVMFTEGPTAAMETIQQEKKAVRSMEPVRSELKGRIVSAENDRPLPGVNVVVKGTTTGTVTDFEGRFKIPVEKDTNLILVADYVGMEQEEFRLNTNEDVIIDLEPDNMSLDEVVVIGYGTERKQDMTGAVSEVDIDPVPGQTDYNPPYPAEGKKAFNEYLSRNLKFPANDTVTAKAVVVLKFTVSKRGKPKDFEIVRSPSGYYSDEAIRLVKEGPEWMPASKDGEKYEERTRLRIVFKREL